MKLAMAVRKISLFDLKILTKTILAAKRNF